jgi:hypothetical protein
MFDYWITKYNCYVVACFFVNFVIKREKNIPVHLGSSIHNILWWPGASFMKLTYVNDASFGTFLLRSAQNLAIYENSFYFWGSSNGRYWLKISFKFVIFKNFCKNLGFFPKWALWIRYQILIYMIGIWQLFNTMQEYLKRVIW